MSKSSANQAIIPLGLKFNTLEGRQKLTEIIKVELAKYERQKIVTFATRTALRTAWYLEKHSIENKPRLDIFYFYWLKTLTAAVTDNFIKTKKSRKVAGYDYVAGYDSILLT